MVGTSLKLRLIHNVKPSEVAVVPTPTLDRTRLVCLAAALFFVLKFPMIFTANNPEELRDFDHYTKASQGQYAYRDFVWLYGPVAPIVYGAALKVFPAKLITVRLVTLAFWSAVACFLALLFARYFVTYRSCLVGVLLASGCTGYPGYSNNHILATLGAVICAYYYLKFIEDKDGGALLWSYAGAALCLFTRPVLMGYGVFGAWSCLMLANSFTLTRIRGWVVLMLTTLATLGVFYLIFGRGLMNAFLPRPWAVLESKSYPNLHYLVPHLTLSSASADVGMQLFKQLRAVLETAVFYLHYFVWPTFVFTAAYLLPSRKNMRAAAICTIIGLAGALDLLHYGFNDPFKEPAMWARGQYFFSLTAVAIFLVVWPTVLHHTERMKSWGARAFLVAIAVWAYLPYVVGWGQLAKFHFNEYGFPALSGVLTHPDRRPLFEAVSFINSQCTLKDAVVVPQYTPGLDRLLHCPDLFGEDAYMFTRMPWYRLAPLETPYAPGGNITNAEVIAQRIEGLSPRFYLFEGASIYTKQCDQPGWSSRIFGTGSNARRVCWTS